MVVADDVDGVSGHLPCRWSGSLSVRWAGLAGDGQLAPVWAGERVGEPAAVRLPSDNTRRAEGVDKVTVAKGIAVDRMANSAVRQGY